MNREQRAPSRIVLSYPQQRALDQWLQSVRGRIEGESWGVERIAVEGTDALGFKVTSGNLRTVLEAVEPPIRLAAANSTNFMSGFHKRLDELEAETNRRLDALEGEATQQSLRVQSLAARVEEALSLLAALEASTKRVGASVAENREHLAVARTEIAKALTELGFRKIDTSVSRAVMQSLTQPEQK